MSLGAKKKLLAGILLVLGVWPGVHLFLSSRYQIDPWEFFGWGMYALPSPQVHVRIEQLVAGRPLLVRPSDSTLERLDTFARERSRFGLFASVDELGRDLLALEPEMQGIVVIVRRWELDLETASFDFEETRHPFQRDRQEPNP